MTLYGVFCRLEAIPSLSTAPAATMIMDVFFLTAATPHTTQYPPTKHGAFHVPVFGFDFKDSFATIVAYRTLTGNSSEVTPFVCTRWSYSFRIMRMRWSYSFRIFGQVFRIQRSAKDIDLIR